MVERSKKLVRKAIHAKPVVFQIIFYIPNSNQNLDMKVSFGFLFYFLNNLRNGLQRKQNSREIGFPIISPNKNIMLENNTNKNWENFLSAPSDNTLFTALNQ